MNIQLAQTSLTTVRPIFMPMYDWREVSPVTRSLETALEKAILDRFGSSGMSFEMWPTDGTFEDRWMDNGLVLSQVCSHSFVTYLSGKLSLVLTPHYSAQGCIGPKIGSYVLVNRESKIRDLESLRGGVAAISGQGGRSDHLALIDAILPLVEEGTFFSHIIETGAPLKAMRAVVEGRADVCCLDAVSWAMAKAYRPDVSSKLVAVTPTRALPGLPWVTAGARTAAEVECIRDAAISVLSDPKMEPVLDKLFISGFSILEAQDYSPVAEANADIFKLGMVI